MSIYTTEPQLTRALAAEMRHNPAATLALLTQKLGIPCNQLTNIECETHQRLDITCEILSGTETKLVGIEAKINHYLSQTQIEKEKANCDYLIILTLEPEDASSYETQVNAVISWKEILTNYPDARITPTDVYQLPSTKVQVEREYLRLLSKLTNPAPCKFQIVRGGGGMPAIAFETPTLANGTTLTGHIEMTRGTTKLSAPDTTYRVFIGTKIDDDLTTAFSAELPSWVKNSRIFYETVYPQLPNHITLSKTSPKIGGPKITQIKEKRRALTEKYLSDCKWTAQGYIDWALGVRVKEHYRFDELEQALADLLYLLNAWTNAIQGN